MTGSVWQGWLANLNSEMRRQRRKILLLIDNAPSHVHDQKKYRHVRIEPFAPNLTAWIQPNDAGIIQSFKSYYRQGLVQMIIEREARSEPNIYKINQLEGMELVHQAWDQVSQTTIANCWRHTKLSGPEPESPPTTSSIPTVTSDATEAVAALQASLNTLQTSTNSAPREPVSAQEYLRLDASLPTEHEWTDKEIVEQVRAELRQEEADLHGEVVHDDDGDDDDPTAADDGHAEATPTTSHAALASLDGLQDLLSKLNPSVFQSDLSVLESLRHKISALDHI